MFPSNSVNYNYYCPTRTINYLRKSQSLINYFPYRAAQSCMRCDMTVINIYLLYVNE